jgi:peptide/nickel transport system substrate-binding protein
MTSGIIRSRFLAPAFFLFILVASPTAGAEAPNASAPFDLLKIGATPPPIDLHPLYGLVDPQFQIYDELVVNKKIKGRKEVKKGALEEFEIRNGGKEFVIHLKKGVRFHNNSPLTANDVAYSLNMLQRSQTYFHPRLKDVTAKVIDENTLALFSENLQDWVPYIDFPLLNAAYEKNHPIEGYIPMGTGPYRFVEYDKNSKILRLERVPGRTTNHPSPARLEYHYFDSPEAATAELLQGTIDFFMGIPTAKVGDVKQRGDFTLVENYYHYTYLIHLNAKKYPLSEPRFRKALSLLINRESLAKVFDGAQNALLPTDAPLYLAWPMSIPKTGKQDVRQALDLFESLGWKQNGGKLMKDGRRFKLEIIFPKELSEYLPLLNLVAKTFADAGIQCAITEAGGFGSFMERYRTGKFEAVFIDSNDGDSLEYSAPRWTTHGDLNYGNYSSKKMDALFKSLKDSKTNRKETKEQIQSLFLEEAPAISLFYTKGYGAFRLSSQFGDSILANPWQLHYLGRDIEETH